MYISPGRPEPGEYASYAQSGIDLVQGDDIVAVLESQIEDTLALLRPIDDATATTLVYAPGKWTLKQVAHHLSDDERIFAYRCLCLARNDLRPLGGFDEKLYASFADSNYQPLSALLDELRIVRQATLALFRSLSPEAWMRGGIVNSYNATVRGLAFHIAGHELHHARIIRGQYLPLLKHQPKPSNFSACPSGSAGSARSQPARSLTIAVSPAGNVRSVRPSS